MEVKDIYKAKEEVAENPDTNVSNSTAWVGSRSMFCGNNFVSSLSLSDCFLFGIMNTTIQFAFIEYSKEHISDHGLDNIQSI